MVMPPLNTLQDVLALSFLASVPHKLHRFIVHYARGSCQGLGQATCPVWMPVVVADQGSAVRYDAPA